MNVNERSGTFRYVHERSRKLKIAEKKRKSNKIVYIYLIVELNYRIIKVHHNSLILNISKSLKQDL